MKYFKNTELAKIYSISEKSVRNWIQGAIEGRLELQLYDMEGKLHIANTSQNTFLIEELVRKGKKYKNSRGSKTITPKQEFYKHFSTTEIYDIISSIDIHREIPHKYSYFADGAKAWDMYARKQLAEPFPNFLKDTIELLSLSKDYLMQLFKGYDSVNVIDLGPGNALPIKNLLQLLLDNGLLQRYVAIDASSDMIDIADKNIKSWFGNRVEVERHIKDISYDKFDDLIIADTFSSDSKSSVLNLVLFLGGTIANLRDADLSLRTICNSLGKDDLLVLTRKVDTEEARRFFDFDTSPEGGKLVEQDRAILDMLGVDESLYAVEQFFDKDHLQRVIQIRLKVALSITFELDGKFRVIELKKDETILLWRATHEKLSEILDKFEENGFDVLQATKSHDKQAVQVIARIKPPDHK